MVMETLDFELKNGIHALSIQAKTTKQWEESSKVIGTSPPCMGGSGR